MRFLVVFAVVASLQFSDAMPLSDCRDHYEHCGDWAKHQYCELKDYKDYMSLVCPYSCGQCDEILRDFTASGKEASGADDEHGAIPEVVADFENFEALGSSSQKSEAADLKDDSASQSQSGSAEDENEPLFRASATKGAESRFDGEAEQQDGTGYQQESISGSGVDSAGVNFWPVVRAEFDAHDRGSDRELYLIRRSEISTPEKVTRASDDYSPPVEATSGEYSSKTRDLPASSGSGQDITSGEDDAPFDTSSADSESDSGCSSGDGCYESESEQGGDGGGVNSRSVISKAEDNAVFSPGSASGDSSPDVWSHPHFDVTAGPYFDATSGSGDEPSTTGSGSVKEDEEKEKDSHEIEDAIFEAGIPLQLSRDTASGSGVPTPPQSQSYDDGSQASGSGSGAAETEESVQLFLTPQHHHRVSLMEKMMKLGKLRAIKISHENVDAFSRNEVPRISDEDKSAQEMQSDLGRGSKVFFVLNQDFHSGYANENSTAYSILASNVKGEIERALGSNTVVSEISFSEVREPAESPRFSKVMASLKLLGDVTQLEKDVKKGMINNLVVDKTFFHAT